MTGTIFYLLGNFVGRAVVSFVLVWLVLWLISRFNWRVALTRSRRWPSILVVIALALLGMAGRMAQVAGVG